MISIIICARNNDISESLKYNIQSTIGTDYELVIVDNHDNGKSIFKAYNEGVSHAKGEILCFMHDDIILHSNGWGLSVEKYFKDSSIGAIGIVGSHIIPRVGDWRVGYTGYHVLNFIQRTYTLWSGRYYSRLTQEGLSGALTDVATIDGVWMCIRRKLFDDKELTFDETTFNSFHFYDVDISMQLLLSGRRLVICNDIIIEHLSEGNYNDPFLKSMELFNEKWEGSLPAVAGMYIDTNTLNAKGKKAMELLRQRVRRDASIHTIKEFRNKEDVCQTKSMALLTAEQRELVMLSEFMFMKTAIKYHPSTTALNKMLSKYLSEDSERKLLVLWKYFLYRILHLKPRKILVQFSTNEQ